MSEMRGSPRIVIQRALCAVAGVDRETLAACPPTDKLWATHLGFSLILSFVVVFGISYHATSYVIENSIMRFATALVIALTVFMFDRALYQSDWFSQGLLRGGEGHAELADHTSPALWRFMRIFVRLAISFALAWVIALFLELAIFSDTITDQIKRDHVKANQATYQKLERYERMLDEDIASRRKSLAVLEALNTKDMAASPPSLRSFPITADQYDPQLQVLDKQEQEIRAAMREINAEITRYAEEMNAEERGQKLKPTQSGRAGTGPRYQFAKQQRDVFLEQRAEREKELAVLQHHRTELRSIQADARTDAVARDNRERENVERRRQNLQAEVDAARSDLRVREESRSSRIDAFTNAALSSSEFQKQKNDPLSRMTAYQELHKDPKDGATITIFSWMTKALVIFLEIVPVLAKIFFSPPSVYGALIQARVARERAKVRQQRAWEISHPERASEPDQASQADMPAQPAVNIQFVPETRIGPSPRPRVRPEEWKEATASDEQRGNNNWDLPLPIPERSDQQEPRAWSELMELSNHASVPRGTLPILNDEAAALTNVVPSSPAATKPWAEALHTIINKSRNAPSKQMGRSEDEDLSLRRRWKEPSSKFEKTHK